MIRFLCWLYVKLGNVLSVICPHLVPRHVGEVLGVSTWRLPHPSSRVPSSNAKTGKSSKLGTFGLKACSLIHLAQGANLRELSTKHCPPGELQLCGTETPCGFRFNFHDLPPTVSKQESRLLRFGTLRASKYS